MHSFAREDTARIDFAHVQNLDLLPQGPTKKTAAPSNASRSFEVSVGQTLGKIPNGKRIAININATLCHVTHTTRTACVRASGLFSFNVKMTFWNSMAFSNAKCGSMPCGCLAGKRVDGYGASKAGNT